MNGYEKLFKSITKLVDTTPIFCKTTMESATSCRFNDLLLEEEDLLIAEHLKTGYVKKVSLSEGTIRTDYVEPLKQGDEVIVLKITDELYAVVERVV